MTRWASALVGAVGLFTRLPVRFRSDPGDVMTCAPVVGGLVGALGGLVAWLVSLPLPRGTTLLPAAVALVALTAVTGALHLDGLADSADALGVRGDAAAIRTAMKSPGLGTFGVVAIALVLLVNLAALDVLLRRGAWLTTVALVTAGAGSRLAAAWACRPAVPAASGEGLGAWVAGTVSAQRVAMATALAIAVVAAVETTRYLALAGLAVAVVVGDGVRRLVARRVGGLTGDVLGALIEVSASVVLVAFALADV